MKHQDRPLHVLSHDAIDSAVARLAALFGRLRTNGPEDENVPFTDEWERKQIYKDLHWK